MLEMITINVQYDDIQYNINKNMIYREDVHFLPMDILWSETKDKIQIDDFKYLLSENGVSDKDIIECMENDILHWIDTYFILFMTEYSISDILLNWVNIEKNNVIPPITSWSQFWCIYYHICTELLYRKYEDSPEKDIFIEWYQEKWYEYYNKGIFAGSYTYVISTTPHIGEYVIVDVKNKYN